MKVLITGANGFIGKKLIAALNDIKDGKDSSFVMDRDITIYEHDNDADMTLLGEYCKEVDFVFHLAGVNHPRQLYDHVEYSLGYTPVLLTLLQIYGNTCPVMMASSSLACFSNPYGEHKSVGEELVFDYGRETGAEVMVYRFPGIIGDWSGPDRSDDKVIFNCNIAGDLAVTSSDPSADMMVVHIDEVVREMIAALNGKANKLEDGYCYMPTEKKTTIREIVDHVCSLRDREPDEQAEKILKTVNHGRITVGIARAGLDESEIWYRTNYDKLAIMGGQALVQVQKVGWDIKGNTYPIAEHRVSGDKATIIDIEPRHAFKIINLSDTEELVTVLWVNERLEPIRTSSVLDLRKRGR